MGAMATRPPAALEAAVSRVGDRWSLLVVDALLAGPRRFGGLQEDLPGVAPNVLSKRLKSLEAAGVVVARPYSRRPPRVEYQLTETGAELAGALRLLTHWGATASPSSDAPHHATCGTTLEPRWYCPTCGEAVEGRDPDQLDYL